MIITLKVLHLFAMAIGLGFGVMKGVLAMRTRRIGPEAAAEHAVLQKIMGRAGLVALATIWVTGVWLLYAQYGGAWGGLGWAFHIKLLFVVLFTAGSLGALFLAGALSRSTMAMVGSGATLALALSIVFAVITFAG